MPRRRLSKVLLCSTLALGAPARADVPPRAVTLDEAVRFARTHQPRVRAAVARVEAELARAEVPRAEWLPRFGATAQIFAATANQTTASSLSARTVDLPRIGGTRATATGTMRPYASTLVGIGGTQELYDFGRIALRSASADARLAVERESAAAVELEAAFDVEEAYFAVLAAKAVARASEDAFARARAHRDLAKAGVSSGLRAPIELTRAESELTVLDITRTRAIGNVTTTQTVLAAVVGSDAPALDALPESRSEAALPSLDEALRRAAADHPRVRQALALLRAAEAETRAIAADSRPDAVLTASVSGRAGGAPPSGNGVPATGDGLLPNVPNWDVGIVVGVPLFDARISAERRAASARETTRREELRATRDETTTTVRRSYVAAMIALSTLDGQRRAEVAARQNYEQADARFRAGLGTSLELADAEAVRTNAEIQTALGEFEVARSRADLGRAIAEGL